MVRRVRSVVAPVVVLIALGAISYASGLLAVLMGWAERETPFVGLVLIGGSLLFMAVVMVGMVDVIMDRFSYRYRRWKEYGRG